MTDPDCKKKFDLPEKIYQCADLAEFVHEAAVVMSIDDVLFWRLGEKQLLIGYDRSRYNRINEETLILWDVIDSIVVVEVKQFCKFIRFDKFDGKLLKYDSNFKNNETHMETTGFIDVRRIPTAVDEKVMEAVNKTEWIPLLKADSTAPK